MHDIDAIETSVYERRRPRPAKAASDATVIVPPLPYYGGPGAMTILLASVAGGALVALLAFVAFITVV